MIEIVEPFKDRFEKALSIRNIRPVELSEKTGILQSTISQYRSGYAEPKSDKLVILSNALDVNPVWLMGIDVPMEMPTSSEEKAENIGRFTTINMIKDRDDSAFHKFLELSDSDKEMVKSMIDHLHIKGN